MQKWEHCYVEWSKQKTSSMSFPKGPEYKIVFTIFTHETDVNQLSQPLTTIYPAWLSVFNDLGEEGWELVSYGSGGSSASDIRRDSGTAVFKRLKS